ncbi:MAG: hypothetical protein Q8P67_10935, partial [archaeon]|nr:hypothetical protein [archaeon]
NNIKKAKLAAFSGNKLVDQDGRDHIAVTLGQHVYDRHADEWNFEALSETLLLHYLSLNQETQSKNFAITFFSLNESGYLSPPTCALLEPHHQQLYQWQAPTDRHVQFWSMLTKGWEEYGSRLFPCRWFGHIIYPNTKEKKKKKKKDDEEESEEKPPEKRLFIVVKDGYLFAWDDGTPPPFPIPRFVMKLAGLPPTGVRSYNQPRVARKKWYGIEINAPVYGKGDRRRIICLQDAGEGELLFNALRDACAKR